MKPIDRTARSFPARRRGWIAAGVAALLGVSGAVWWSWHGEESMPEPRAGVLENARVSADESAPKIVAVAPQFEDRDAPRTERTGVDASTFYKDAFALCDRLSAEEKQMLSHPSEEVDADKAAALFEKIQPIMELLRRGAAADFCEWGLGEPKVDRPFPQLGKSQYLGQVALWNAAYRFPTDAEGAIDDLSARAGLGHHLAETLLGFLVESSLEKSAVNLLRQNAATLDDAARGKAVAFLAASALDGDIHLALPGEIKFASSGAEKFVGMTPEGRVNMLRGLPNYDEEEEKEASIRAEAVVRDPALFRAEMEFVSKAQAKTFEAMFWPDPQFNAWMRQFDRSHFAEHPIATAVMPVYRAIREDWQARRIEREMLNLGLAVLESGGEVVSSSRDSVTGRPFVYSSKPGGFELRSAFKLRRKPVTMSFDLPKKDENARRPCGRVKERRASSR